MYISNHEIRKQEIYPELFSNLGLFKFFGFHNQRSSLLFSLISKLFQWVGTFLIPMSVFWGGRTIKENYCISFFSVPHKNSLYSLFYFFLSMSPNNYLPKTSHVKRKVLMGLLDSYEKFVGLKSFNKLEEGPNGSI